MSTLYIYLCQYFPFGDNVCRRGIFFGERANKKGPEANASGPFCGKKNEWRPALPPNGTGLTHPKAIADLKIFACNIPTNYQLYGAYLKGGDARGELKQKSYSIMISNFFKNK